MDALQPLASITGGIMEGLPDRPGFYPGGLTMILTNPPFGSKVTSEAILKDLASRDGVTKKDGKVIPSLAQEIVFINRCLEFLKPGGKLGIVLPDGVLANSSMQVIREWILRWARLKAVVSLPQETFTPYGAGVKTSILYLEKREKVLSIEGQLDLRQELSDDEYSVYIARISDIGYDANGRLTVSDEDAPNPLDIREAVKDFVQKSK
jgi:type I restriction enzyme M protein